ncbi:MAG: hypothetical protein LW878_10235 [Proteobacteria bacterium]|nr:hypothetical protein [Pseudomonadota bacterium]
MKNIIFVYLCFLISFNVNASGSLQLSDLGIDATPLDQSPTAGISQVELKERHSMLKTHELLGLTTLGVMTAALFSGGNNNAHMYLGISSGLLYYTTAYYSLSAPKPAGVKERGNIVWHKRLAWIHFPAMVLAPVLGYLYKKNQDDGKESSSLVKQHQTIAGIGYGAFALSAALMTIEF